MLVRIAEIAMQFYLQENHGSCSTDIKTFKFCKSGMLLEECLKITSLIYSDDLLRWGLSSTGSILSEEQAFTSPASDHSTEQAKRTEDSEWHLFNEHPEGKAQQDPSHCPM